MGDMEKRDQSEQEIADACAAIQRTWSDAERQRRRWGLMPGSRHANGAAPDIGWTAPVIVVDADMAAMLNEHPSRAPRDDAQTTIARAARLQRGQAPAHGFAPRQRGSQLLHGPTLHGLSSVRKSPEVLPVELCTARSTELR
jgi:hypothetical protein